jgi:alkyl hydroperoxide reductase subunit AhpF
VWKLSLVSSDGTRFEDSCEILVNGSGVLKFVPLCSSIRSSADCMNSSWKYPNIEGIREFKGKLMHSATWDASYDLKGKTVAVIGGGSSAVQIIPQIQPGQHRIHSRKAIFLS